MAMTFRHPLRRKRKKGDTAQLAAQLAPLEEQDAHAARRQGANGNGPGQHGGLIQEHGALIVDTDNLHVLRGLDEGNDSETGRFFGIEPVVLVILCAMLVFIAFIAWKISQMPLKQ
ncbi:MAG TPA: hypothetical protein VF634_14210 [Pyrinomonadaceae bacterium]